MPSDQRDAEKTETSVFSGGDRPISKGLQMERFMIHWCARDPTSQKYTEAIVNTSRVASPWMNLLVSLC